MSEATMLDDAAGTAPSDPLARIADAVREVLPGAAGDQLVSRIAEILASAPPADLERVALENAQLQHELELMQSVDTLTGLRNRQRFFEDLKREVAAARRHDSALSLIVLDVDGLRQVNERSGYSAGDRLLLTLGELLLTRLRVTDIAARIGDDDFAVILPRTPLAGAARLAERIGETLGDWVDIGVAALDATVTSGADLLERADRDLAARRSERTRPPAA
ncbi:MAG TPA: GGDEF domain-containing protein [Gaiellaceae bacterium]|nr:GGDEF domain-containing protein [Gaiellaceae bacterium]